MASRSGIVEVIIRSSGGSRSRIAMVPVNGRARL